MAEPHDTIETEPAPRPRRGTALSTPLLGILLGVLGTAAMAYGFVNGISAALDGTDGNSGVFIGIFIAGGVAALIAIVIGVVGLIRGGHRFLSLLSLLVGLVPAAVIVAIRIANS